MELDSEPTATAMQRAEAAFSVYASLTEVVPDLRTLQRGKNLGVVVSGE